MSLQLLPGEHTWLSAVVSNLADDDLKLRYADWLEQHDDERAAFLRKFVAAAKTMDAADFPPAEELPQEWVTLLGYWLLQYIAEAGVPQLKDRVLPLARPALYEQISLATDEEIPVSASKFGGLPDLPPGFTWPRSGDCEANFSYEGGVPDRLCGFLAQINFAEVADMQAARELPKEGLLSFFGFQDIEHDCPSRIGVCARFFPSTAGLVRTSPPEEQTEGNGLIQPRRWTFDETLDIPEASDGPWSDDLVPDHNATEIETLAFYRDITLDNLLGYDFSTTGGDPTRSKQSRFLVSLENESLCGLHIQIHEDDLKAHRFEKITLNWIDLW